MTDSGEDLLIGVDGGGTGCRVAVGNASHGIIAESAGPRANVSSDLRGAIANICDTVLDAAQKAGWSEKDLVNATAHLGLAGVMSAQTSQAVAEELPYKNSIVTSDVPTAIMGAMGGEDGFLAAIGTGTFITRSCGGVHRSVGGWGLNVADQASGSWLGREALNRALLCHDGLLEHTDLTTDLMKHFENDPVLISAFAQNASPRDFGAFCPAVIQAADAGDEIGSALLELGTDYILQCLTALNFSANDTLYLGGGVGPQYSEYIRKRSDIRVSHPKNSGVFGAFELAKQTSQSTQMVSQ
jgi:glucosamine kinase